MKLHIPTSLYEQVQSLVMSTELETGVSLFGERDGDTLTVVGIAGPGPNATHETYHYSGDEDYKNEVYQSLLKENPKIEYIGELHAHPFGMSWLSRADVRTVKSLLKEFPYFIAGVMLRNPFEMFCWYFPGKQKVEVVCEHRGNWSRLRWFDFGRYAWKIRDRRIGFDRSRRPDREQLQAPCLDARRRGEE